MTKKEHAENVKVLTEKFKDNMEIRTGRNKKQYAYYQLGQIDVPEEAKGLYLRVLPDDDGIPTLYYIQQLGFSPEEREKRRQERAKKAAGIRKQKEVLRAEIKKLKVEKKELFAKGSYDKFDEIDKAIETKETALDELVIRKRK